MSNIFEQKVYLVKIDGKDHKQCSRCKETLPVSSFQKRKEMACGYRSHCKLCQKKYDQSRKEDKNETSRKWRAKQRADGKDYYQMNREKILAKKKESYCPEIQKERLLKSKDKRKEWRRRPHVVEREKAKWRKKYYSDIGFKIKNNINSRIYILLRQSDAKKYAKRTVLFLGCSIEELKSHLEKQFKDGMSWGHFTNGEIHIDHIRPCASFDLKDPEQQKICFHYTNLQPLWWKDNLSKGAKWSPETENNAKLRKAGINPDEI